MANPSPSLDPVIKAFRPASGREDIEAMDMADEQSGTVVNQQ
jgi:hypothetical protein